MSAAGLELSGLACAAGYRTLFSGVAFSVRPGGWLMLAGPNGTGKSTLLRAIAGLIRPVSGEVRWLGAPRDGASDAWREAMLYQGHANGWKDLFSARENLASQLELDGERASADRLGELLERVGLARQARLPFGRLSAGQRRRLSLARIAASRRPLWLLDEPTTALDSAGQALFGALLDEHLARGGCAVVATHLGLPCATEPSVLQLGEFAGR